MFGLFKIVSLFRNSELQKRILFTCLLLLVVRIATCIPVLAINSSLVSAYFDDLRSVAGAGVGLFQVAHAFSGGAFSRGTIVSLGVGPYISATIVMHLFVTFSGSWQREMRDMPELAQKRLGVWTRYLTLLVAILQSIAFAQYMLYINTIFPGVVVDHIKMITIWELPVLFYLIFVATTSVGSLALVWLGEKITKDGIGNGVSLLITVGILSAFPGNVMNTLSFSGIMESINVRSLSFLISWLFMLSFMTIATLYLSLGQKNVMVMYARKIVGRRVIQGAGAPYIPLRLNHAGVMPVIFASTFLMVPATIAQFFSNSSSLQAIARMLTPDSIVHTILYVALILFFSYFWTELQFKPDRIASDMQKNGAFIPGVRQGRETEKFLASQMHLVTLFGSLMLASIAIFPVIFAKLLVLDSSLHCFIGGTSLLLVVGSCVDTSRQIDGFLYSSKYQGSMNRLKK